MLDAVCRQGPALEGALFFRATRASVWSRPGFLAAVVVALAAPRVRAEGLRVTESVEGLEFDTANNQRIGLLIEDTTLRVSRGQAGLSLEVPFIGLSGGDVALADESYAVTGGDNRSRFGLGDMAVGLDYNIIQNRERMFILTLTGSLRFPTSPAVLNLGNGEYLFAAGLSAVYGITRKLLAYADIREGWVGILTPAAQRLEMAQLGGIYWFTDRLGLSSSLMGADYAGRVPPSLQLNAGLSVELFWGIMTNVGAIAGLFGSAPQAGGQLGFSFEI